MKKIVIVAVVLLFVFSSCKKEKVGSACEYEDITKTVSVTFINGELNSEKFMISFQPIGDDSDEIYRVTRKKLIEIKKNFDNTEFQNKENIFNLTIAEITKGSCIPFAIKEIVLVN